MKCSIYINVLVVVPTAMLLESLVVFYDRQSPVESMRSYDHANERQLRGGFIITVTVFTK